MTEGEQTTPDAVFEPPARVLQILREHFGHSGLRPEQTRAMEPILAGQDVVIVMPTGSGKSLCYQLPGLVQRDRGITVVISPLIALMKDQVDALNTRRLAAGTLNSLMEPEERAEVLSKIRSGRLNFLYIAPERLGHQSLVDLLSDVGVGRVAVDEAHCASEWGHDFRPDYLKIADFVENVGRPQVLALTATATPQVRDDIVHLLRLPEPAVIVAGFDRPNISCRVLRARGEQEREQALLHVMSENTTAPGASLVYAATRKNAELVAGLLHRHRIKCGVYHAGMDAEDRTRVQDLFMSGKLQTICATNAFGMGIDRRDVRRVIHWDLPGSLDAYYQEIGRAGRDGGPASATLIFSEQSVHLQNFFLDAQHPSIEILECIFEKLETRSREVWTVEFLETTFKEENNDAARIGTQAAVAILIGSGCITRDPQGRLLPTPGFRGDLSDAIDTEAMNRRRDHGSAKLGAMLDYGRRQGCRRNMILDYFAAERDPGTCGRCDYCVRVPTVTEPLRGDDLLTVRKILSGVARTRGYAGRSRLIAMLHGSSAKDIRGTWLERLSTYGCLRDLPRKRISAGVDALIDAHLIEMGGGTMPTLRLSEKGLEVMKGTLVPSIPWPKSEHVEVRASEVIPEDDGDSLEARGLSARLRLWRIEIARQLGVPAYHILTNQTIEDISRRQPASSEELLECPGIGPVKLERFGAAILAIVAGDDP